MTKKCFISRLQTIFLAVIFTVRKEDFKKKKPSTDLPQVVKLLVIENDLKKKLIFFLQSNDSLEEER